MKKFISVMLCVCICLSSTVFCFADFTSTDSTTLSNIYKYMPTASQVTTLNNTLSTINTRVLNIYNALFDGNHSVAYWVHAIDSFMSPILTAIQNTPTQLDSIKRLLGHVSYEGETEIIDPYLAYNGVGVAKYTSDLYAYQKDLRDTFFNYYLYQSSIDANIRRHNSHTNWVNEYGNYSLPNLDSSFNYSYTTHAFQNGSPLGNIGMVLYRLTNNQGITAYRTLAGYSDIQEPLNWLTLENNSFTATSQTQGIYKWLKNIQAPVARLSYVLANDQEIAAREAASDNQDAVVNNFIDSSGSGAASTSDIGSVSDLSSGFKINISTDASVSGIWNIFNDDNFGWFSQETADQLDTSNSGKKTLKNSGSYPTPLLDQQTEDIMRILGGNDND